MNYIRRVVVQTSSRGCLRASLVRRGGPEQPASSLVARAVRLGAASSFSTSSFSTSSTAAPVVETHVAAHSNGKSDVIRRSPKRRSSAAPTGGAAGANPLEQELLDFVRMCRDRRDVIASDIELVVQSTEALGGRVSAALFGTMCELLKWTAAGSPEETLLLERLTELLKTEGSILNVLSLKRIADIIASLGNVSPQSELVSHFVELLALRVEALPSSRPLPPRSIGFMLLGLRNMDVSLPPVQRLLRSIIPKVEECPELFDSHSIGNAMCALRLRRDAASDSGAGVELVDALASALLVKLVAVPGALSAQSLCNILYSMKSWPSDGNKVISDIILETARRVEACPDTFEARQVALSLFGLQKMRGHSQPVRQLLNALVVRVAACPGEWADIDVSCALTGLRNMSSDDAPEVAAVVGALAAQLSGSRRSPLSAATIASAFRGLVGMSSDVKEVRDMATALQYKIMMSQDKFTPFDLSSVVFGMQSMDSSHSEILDLVMVIGDKLRSCGDVFSAKELASIMYGLKRMRSDNEVICSLLHVVASKVKDCKDTFGGREIGSFLYGVQSMSSDAEEVRGLLGALTDKIRSSPAACMKPQEIGNALYGLRGMRSEFSEIRSLVSELARLVRGTSAVLGAQALSNALNGLSGMDHATSGAELVDLLSSLSDHLNGCKEDFSIKDLGGAFFGLRGLSCDNDAVRAIVSNLTARLKRCVDPVDPGSLAMAFYGLRSMSSENKEVQLLLEVLASKLANIDKSMTCRDVSAAIFGLQNMKNNSIVVENVLNGLSKHLEVCAGEDFDAQAIMTVLYGLQNMRNDSAAVRRVLAALLSKLEAYRGPALTAQEGRVAASGLRLMDANSREVRAVLEWLRRTSSTA